VNINVRPARPGDEPEIVAMIYELAVFERVPEQCTVTESQMTAGLFGPAPTTFCHIAEVDGEPAAIAVWFRNLDTWDGGYVIYLEVLFVRERFRRHRLGRAILATLARECVEHGYSRISWTVLRWNSPAIALYDAVGGRQMSEWIGYRLAGPELSALAGE